MAAPGEIGLDLHLNYVLSGRSTPDWPGELPPRDVFLSACAVPGVEAEA